MIRETIAIRVIWNSILFRRVFFVQSMTIDGGHDIKLLTEGGEQLLLEYL